MGLYIDYYISPTPTFNDNTNKTELDYKSGEIIMTGCENSVISSEKIKELTGLIIPPTHYIIQVCYSTYSPEVGYHTITIV